ncbi:hypothetical protein M413DRAFT_25659 [Hebeloma cylindrosporum]|uniref:Uncharacterized protein n=1 Tax=Hebeloma cylindrosporum TaxID=76867 RepID=A0A0C3C5T3_HEBCY|nr:hypothetical protein M413DRAFT_25659 [Hebeloma cylindrosporum h7]
MAALCSRCSTKLLRPARCTVFHGTPCAACTEDIELEKEINELESRIEKIHVKRRALRTIMNENHDLLIHRFPPEIASHIFIQSTLPSTCFGKSDRNNDGQLYLGAVCQKWRQLAWATPGVWTSLCIAFRRYNNNSPQIVNEWLERSATLPLTVRLKDSWGWLDRDSDDEIVKHLNKHSARWHDMHFELAPRRLHLLCGSSQGNLLRRLVLCKSSAQCWERPSFSTFSMKSIPSPTDLTLTKIGLQYVDIIWNNITVASVDKVGVDDCFELIRRASLLETLTLRSINPSSNSFPIPNTRIVQSRLHSLELFEITQETVLTTILDALCLPSLQQFIHHRSPLPVDDLSAFVGYFFSSCLKTLKISVLHVNDHQLTTLLPHLSSLEFLELRATSGFEWPPTEELFTLLCASESHESPIFLPHLRSLEFLCRFHFPWKWIPQIFALSRWKSLKVKVDIDLHLVEHYEAEAKQLLELVEEGFDLSFVRLSNYWVDEMRNIDFLEEYKAKQRCS